MNYLLTLRALFRSIVGGRFEVLYSEFRPLLPSFFLLFGTCVSLSHPNSFRHSRATPIAVAVVNPTVARALH